MFSVGPPWRFVTRITCQLKIELRESVEMTTERIRRDCKKELGCEKTSCVLE
jgi:hypothetical protein